MEKFLNATPQGRRFPLFDGLLVDEQDQLWVREYVLDGDSVEWQVVDMTRGAVARVKMPSGWTVLEAGTGYVLVRERDEFDVETVRKYTVGPS